MGFFGKVFDKAFPTNAPINKKRNPYTDNPFYTAPPPGETSTYNSAREARERPASPRGTEDFLREARMAVGRDPLTGRERPGRNQHNDPTPTTHRSTSTQRIPNATSSQPNPTPQPPARSASSPSNSPSNPFDPEPSPYNTHATALRTSTSKYDLYIRDMKRQREEAELAAQQRLRETGSRMPEGGYYAPEGRRETLMLATGTEYYTPGSG